MSDVDPGFDLDEDLFNFDELLAHANEETEKVDLEELLRVLEKAPDPTIGAEPEIEADDELIGEESPAPAPVPAGAHAESASPTLQHVSAPDAPYVSAVPAAASQAPARMAPAMAPAGPAPRTSVISSRFALIGVVIFAGLALLNILSVGLSWERGRDMTASLDEMERRFLQTTGDLRQELFHQSSAMERQLMPIVSPAGEASALDMAQALIADGRYAEARQRIHALLAVIDRYDAETREELEGRAAYLLGDAWFEQAQNLEAKP